MKTLRYLNTVLTVIAILLTLNVYLQLTGTPAGGAVSVAQEAHAADKPARGVGSSAQAQLDPQPDKSTPSGTQPQTAPGDKKKPTSPTPPIGARSVQQGRQHWL